MAFRGLISNETAFAGNRFDARGDYLYATGGVQRTQDLFAGTKLFVKADGQVSDAPLINNEQYSGGGIDNVRGYQGNRRAGRQRRALHRRIPWPRNGRISRRMRWKTAVYAVYFLRSGAPFIMDPLPGQEPHFNLEGTGVGVKGIYDKCFEYETCWATALSEHEHTKAGDSMVHFRVKYLY